MIKGNIGEWSEIYALFKILGDKKLYAGDANLNRIEELMYPIIKVLRFESNQLNEYFYKDEIVIVKGDDKEFRIAVSDFVKQSNLLLSKLKEKSGSTFSIPEVEDFMSSFNCSNLKAKSSTKSDIRLKIHDSNTSQEPTLGFSIKSRLGGLSTLLNAGKTTNFIYEIKNVDFTDEQINAINEINGRQKIRDRINSIIKRNGKFDFFKTEKSIFDNNLVLIDSDLPSILSNMIFKYFTSKHSKIKTLISQVAQDNPERYNLEYGHPFYEYKIKKCLVDIALGMMPGSMWNGIIDATGGYLIVKEDGDIVCYHIYNRNEFENYLYENTKLETASSTRHDFGKIYRNGDKVFFKLNLQIRFI